jgi:hypothetical protein
MKVLALASLAFLCVSCGDDSSAMDMSTPDMSIPPDLLGVDLRIPPDFKGISCGMNDCDAMTQDCCLTGSGMNVQFACMPRGTCNTDAGASLMCDGPEDCSSGMPSCCATIGASGDQDAGVQSASGAAKCSNTCPASATLDLGPPITFSGQSKLCHAKADCAGYMGTFNGQQQPFNNCCSIPLAGTSQSFCAPQIATMAGTCVN